MASHAAARARSCAALVWLLALLLPCQAMAIAWVGAAGPAHVHGAGAPPASAELVDFRRASASIAAAAHEGAHASGDRHHHPAGDASESIAIVDGWSAVERDAPDDGRTPFGAAFLPLIASLPFWHAAEAGETFGAATRWAPIANVDPPLERPPR